MDAESCLKCQTSLVSSSDTNGKHLVDRIGQFSRGPQRIVRDGKKRIITITLSIDKFIGELITIIRVLGAEYANLSTSWLTFRNSVMTEGYTYRCFVDVCDRDGEDLFQIQTARITNEDADGERSMDLIIQYDTVAQRIAVDIEETVTAIP